MRVDRAALVGILDELKERKLLERRPHRGDRRHNVISLTDDGHALLRALPLARAAEEAALAALTKRR
jgi:DNA-binding MarR family transcriptional regulator